MKMGKKTLRSMSTCTFVLFALIYVAAIDIRNKRLGVYALITGEPINILFNNAGKHKPPPPKSDSTDEWDCTSRIGNATANDSSSCPFVYKKLDLAFRTDAGELKVVILGDEHLMQRRKMAVGLLTMEPAALLLPQYLNGPTVFYVHRGQANLWYVDDGKQKSKVLIAGEVHAISAGSP
eukprot:c8780_g1_i1 orf=137-673(+)